jgi:hypothetical protein
MEASIDRTIPHILPLTVATPAHYPAIVAETTATGFGDPYKVRRISATRRIFYVRMPLRASFNGRALAGRPSGLPVASFAGSPTPSCARSPPFGDGKRVSRSKRRPHHAAPYPRSS